MGMDACGFEVSFQGDENALVLDCGGCCTSLNTLKATEFYTSSE
jgi:hypothetical protein